MSEGMNERGDDKAVAERLRDVECEDFQKFDCGLFAAVNGTENCGDLDCRECRRRTCEALADLVEGATPSKSTGLPEGIIWPTFEDGDLVKFGDKFVDAEGRVCDLNNIHFYRNRIHMNAVDRKIEYGEPVIRPEPEVLDADGVPIKVGDTVYLARSPRWPASTVVEVSSMHALIESGGGKWEVRTDTLTHRKPDTQETIDADALKSPCKYFGAEGANKCSECPQGQDDADVDYARCRANMTRDLLARQRRLMGGE